MDALPVEVTEKIIKALPSSDLFNAAKVNRTWWKIARHEAYRRWRGLAINIGRYGILGYTGIS